MTKNIGIDVGFGFVKATDGNQRYVFPSVVGEAHDLRFNTGMDNMSILDNLIIQSGTSKCFVGELAKRQSRFTMSTQSENRTESKENEILFQTALALLAGVDSKDDDYNLVTGLPVDEYHHYKDILQEQMKGVHIIELFSGDSSIKKSIKINKCKVVPQPFGTIFNEILTEDGGIKTERYLSSKLGVIDIGFRTTDFVVTDNLDFIDKLSFTSNVALNTAYKYVSYMMKEELNISKSIYQLDDIMKNGAIKVKGEEYEIAIVKDKAYTLAVQQIVSEINSFWPQLWEFHSILITGGGGRALFDYIKEDIDNCYLIDDAQFSNVAGYLKIANRSFKE